MDDNWKLNNIALLKHFDAIASVMTFHWKQKQKFSSPWKETKTNQKRGHLTSSNHLWLTNVCGKVL